SLRTSRPGPRRTSAGNDRSPTHRRSRAVPRNAHARRAHPTACAAARRRCRTARLRLSRDWRDERPRPLAFEHASKVEYQCVFVMTADDLQADWQTVDLTRWDRAGGVAADVGGNGEGAVVLRPDRHVTNARVECDGRGIGNVGI